MSKLFQNNWVYMNGTANYFYNYNFKIYGFQKKLQMHDFLAVNKLKFMKLVKTNDPVTNYLFFISKENIARKQILQVTYML